MKSSSFHLPSTQRVKANICCLCGVDLLGAFPLAKKKPTHFFKRAILAVWWAIYIRADNARSIWNMNSSFQSHFPSFRSHFSSFHSHFSSFQVRKSLFIVPSEKVTFSHCFNKLVTFLRPEICSTRISCCWSPTHIIWHVMLRVFIQHQQQMNVFAAISQSLPFSTTSRRHNVCKDTRSMCVMRWLFFFPPAS